MDRCPNCGNKLSDIDVLCTKCGSVVEVIQIKSNNSPNTEAETEAKSKSSEAVQKKDIPKYFNVYYEDLPDEDSEDNPEAVPEESSQEASETPDPEAISHNYDENDIDMNKGQIKSKPEIAERSDSDDYKAKNTFACKIITAKADEADFDYSPRYLENLKNLNLPEIEDISNFDPEEFMREYKYKKILSEQSASEGSSASAKKQWLEIEETGTDLETELKKVKDDVLKQETAIPAVQRRYRGDKDNRVEKRQDTRTERKREIISEDAVRKREITGEDAARKREIISEDATEIPSKTKNSRKPKTASMILLWVVISVAILFSCIFFDNYVKLSYRDYDSFINSITNGQVDLDPSKP